MPGLKFTLQAQGGFGFLELGVDDATENHPLLSIGERVGAEMDAELGKPDKVCFVGADDEETCRRQVLLGFVGGLNNKIRVIQRRA